MYLNRFVLPLSPKQPGQTGAGGGIWTPPQSTVQPVTLHPLDEPGSALARRSIYFDFDSSLSATRTGPSS